MSGCPEEVYVLLKGSLLSGDHEVTPLVAHTTQQGAAMEMVSYPANEQRVMWVVPVRLVNDHDD